LQGFAHASSVSFFDLPQVWPENRGTFSRQTCLGENAMSRYFEVYQSWKRDPVGFWAAAAEDIDWVKPAERIFDPNQANTAGGSRTASATLASIVSTGTSLPARVRTSRPSSMTAP
jgi:hypothetical protein